MPPPSWIRIKGVRWDVLVLEGKGREGGWIRVGFVSNILLSFFFLLGCSFFFPFF